MPANCRGKTLNTAVIKELSELHFRKITITVIELVFIQVFFLTVGSKQKINKNENTKYHCTWYHWSISSTEKRQSHFSLVWVMRFSIISSCLGKVRVSNQAILADVQRVQKKGKWICVFYGVYNLFKKIFLLLHTTLLKCFIHSRVGKS